MARRVRLVVDASVLRSAGSASSGPSAGCRRLLASILDICHQAAAGPELRREWRLHRSAYSSTWLRSMYARKKVFALDSLPARELEDSVEKLELRDKERQAVLKDLHLICAALETDQRVVSRDSVACDLFKSLAQDIASLRSVVWVNPDDDSIDIESWLADGCPAQSVMTLASDDIS